MLLCSIAAKVTIAAPMDSPLLSIVEKRHHQDMLSALPAHDGECALRGTCPCVVACSIGAKWDILEYGSVLLIFPQQTVDGDAFLRAAATLHGA